MKYYIYVSDTKVEMLYSQIPRKLRDTLATELKIDLKLLSSTWSQEPPEATRYSKVKMVEEYIENHENVGTVDEPASYFRGRMPLHWRPIPYADDDRAMAYFTGETGRSIVGLGGSLKHVIGGVAVATSTLPPTSSLYAIQLALESASVSSKVSQEAVVPSWLPDQNLEKSLVHVARLFAEEGVPIERCEFLAKRLFEGHERLTKIHVVLGSPIYVAVAE